MDCLIDRGRKSMRYLIIRIFYMWRRVPLLWLTPLRQTDVLLLTTSWVWAVVQNQNLKLDKKCNHAICTLNRKLERTLKRLRIKQKTKQLHWPHIQSCMAQDLRRMNASDDFAGLLNDEEAVPWHSAYVPLCSIWHVPCCNLNMFQY